MYKINFNKDHKKGYRKEQNRHKPTFTTTTKKSNNEIGNKT